MAYAAMLGIENNLDWCHAVFAHPWAHGQFFKTHLVGFTEQTYETRLTDDGMVLFGPATPQTERATLPQRRVVTVRA